MAEEKTHTEAGEQAPSTVEQQAPEVAEANAPATSEATATSIPSANAPDPTAVNSGENPNAAKPKQAAKAEGEAAPKAKKEKAPALEDKPFAEFVQQHYLPALKEGLAKQGIQEVELVFEKRPVNVTGFQQLPPCWQIVGHWNSSWKQTKEFTLYFFEESVQGQKGFSYSESGGRASTLESFLIDERKPNLGLLVFGVLQRLNAQKWLVRN